MSKKIDPDLEDFDDQVEIDIDKEPEKEKPALSHPSYEELAKQLTAAERKADENWETSLRLQAELENMRRRSERDLAQAHKYGLEKIAQELLTVMDNLERALATMKGGDSDVHRTGVEMTLKQLQSLFDKFGIKALDPLGKAFDPALHEAMAMRQSDAAPGTVVEVLQKGYQINDRLLRPALVAVSANK